MICFSIKTYGLDAKLLDCDEKSEILMENAKEKASQLSKETGYYCLGDDSGVFFEALDYFPGVHSRRWGFEETDDHKRNCKILELLQNCNGMAKPVYLISRFSLTDPNGNELFATVVKNEFQVSKIEQGKHGFGYDFILIPLANNIIAAHAEGRLPDWSRVEDIILNKRTIAELSQDEKNAINNRGKIAMEIKTFLDGE